MEIKQSLGRSAPSRRMNNNTCPQYRLHAATDQSGVRCWRCKHHYRIIIALGVGGTYCTWDFECNFWRYLTPWMQSYGFGRLFEDLFSSQWLFAFFPKKKAPAGVVGLVFHDFDIFKVENHCTREGEEGKLFWIELRGGGQPHFEVELHSERGGVEVNPSSP